MKHVWKCVLGILLAVANGIAVAAGYPSRPVTFIVPYSAGGPIDVLVRALADALRAEWKQPVLVDNRPGANEIIGADLAARAPNDGYTVFVSSEAALLLNPFLYTKLSYDPAKQFAAVTQLVKAPLVFTVPAQSKAMTMKHFIEQARARGKESVTYGSAGIGGPTHLPFAAIGKEYGIHFTHVPYKGGAPVMQALLANEVEAGVIGGSMIEPHVKAGKLRGLAVSSEARLAALPDIPTFRELGITDPEANYIVALVTPVGTPLDVINKIAKDTRKVLMDPKFRATNIDPFALVPVGSSPAEFAAFLKTQRPVQQKRVLDSGARLDQ